MTFDSWKSTEPDRDPAPGEHRPYDGSCACDECADPHPESCRCSWCAPDAKMDGDAEWPDNLPIDGNAGPNGCTCGFDGDCNCGLVP